MTISVRLSDKDTELIKAKQIEKTKNERKKDDKKI